MRLHCGLMPEKDQADSKIRCRACGSKDVWYSRPTPADRFLGFFWRFKAFRCRACQHRFRVGLSRQGDANPTSMPLQAIIESADGEGSQQTSPNGSGPGELQVDDPEPDTDQQNRVFPPAT